MIGQRIAHYQIVEKLGEGGMGVVYKARDAHLDRFVAIKVLPPEWVADPERKRRFIQEAKAASALNFPGIVTVHDILSHDGLDFIVMEHIEGRTLDKMIGHRGLHLNDALKYAVQIAEALAKAHSEGIIHRDLKPGNVMITADGMAKVLDFGLAKLTEIAPPGEDESTRTLKVTTEEGTIVGTVAYMSPEQAEGKKLDCRSDIFSFGALLYEMLTGHRAFQGESRLSTLAAIIRDEPRSTREFAETIPREVDRIVSRCLRKDPARRIQTAADLKVALADLKEESESGTLAAASAPAHRQRIWWWAAGVVLAAAAVAGTWLALRRPAPQSPIWQVRRLTSDEGVSANGSLSPDGRLFAFVSDREGRGQRDLFIQQTSEGTPVRRTDGKLKVGAVAFSPDGALIAFQTIGEDPAIYTIPAIGGEPRRIAQRMSHTRSASFLHFSPDGKWICSKEAAGEFDTRLMLAPVGGGNGQMLTPNLHAPATGGDFVWSPEGNGLLLSGGGTVEAAISGELDYWFIRLDGSVARTGAKEIAGSAGLRALSPIAWVGDRLLFQAEKKGTQDLYEMRLPPGTRKAVGPAKPLTSGWAGRSIVSTSTDCTRVLFTDSDLVRRSLWTLPLDAGGRKALSRPERLSKLLRDEDSPVALDGGRKLLFRRADGQRNAFVVRDSAAEKDTVVVESASRLNFPVVTRDSAHLAYLVYENKQRVVYVVSLRGGVPRRVCAACGRPTDWSPDGAKLLAHDLRGEAGKAGLIELKSGETKVLWEHRQRIYNPAVSPDGQWVVFTLRVPGPYRTVVARYREDRPTSESEWTVIRDDIVPETYFRWGPSGAMLYFLRWAGDNRKLIWALPFQLAEGRAGGPAFSLFEPVDQRIAPNDDEGRISISALANRLYFAQTETQTSIWFAEAEK